MRGKIFRISLGIVILLSLFFGISTAKADSIVVDKNSLSTITIEGVKCNITVKESENDKLKFNYDTNIFQVTTTKSSSDNIKITVKTKENAKPLLTDRVYIYIPTSKISKLDVICSNAAIALDKINTKLNIQNNKGVVSFYAFQGLSNNIKYTSHNGVGQLKIVKGASDYSLNLANDSSVVKIPFSDYKRFSSNYTHTQGDGSKNIDIDLHKSVFSVLLDVKDVVEDKNTMRTVTVEGIDCNITIEKSENKDFKYDYNAKMFQVTTTESSLDNIKITIKKRENAKPLLTDRVYIYIPTDKISKLDVISSNAAITLGKINTNLNIQNDNGIVSFYAIQALTNDINYTSQNGIGRLKIVKGMSNYSFNLSNDSSLVKVPFSDYKRFNSSYTHKQGNGSKNIDIDLHNSIFSVLLDVED